jgi:hypothetical protein
MGWSATSFQFWEGTATLNNCIYWVMHRPSTAERGYVDCSTAGSHKKKLLFANDCKVGPHTKWGQNLNLYGVSRVVMYNCTWNKDGKKFLGGSLASTLVPRLNSFNTDIAGTWGRVVKRARYRLINREILGLSGWSFETRKKNANRQLRRMLSVPIYASVSSSPFEGCLDIICNTWRITIRGHGRENEDVFGISLQYKGVRRQTYEDGLSGET